MKSDSYTKYTEQTYSGKKLLREHKLDEYGKWDIYGEDLNGDFGGSHHVPFLITLEGKLEDVIRYAVQMERFWTWGGGGDIRPSTREVIKVDDKQSPKPIGTFTTKDMSIPIRQLRRRLKKILKRWPDASLKYRKGRFEVYA